MSVTNLRATVSGNNVGLDWSLTGHAEEIVILYREEAGPWKATAIAQNSTKHTLSNLPAGTHYFRVIQDESDANVSATIEGTPAPTPAPTPTPAPASPVPNGPSGNWKLLFDEDFDGNALNLNVWDPHDGWQKQNGVTDYASNVTVANSICSLHLPVSNSGAAIQCKAVALAVGDYCEARINFAGNGTSIDDWPAFWASGPGWPAAGENDIAEGLGTLTVNYHSPSGAHNMGEIPGDWANGFHTYGCQRFSDRCVEYWDGQQVKSYSTDDNGQAQSLILTVGYGGGQFIPMELQCDYVRVWSPA
jgi:hypothetical protein